MTLAQTHFRSGALSAPSVMDPFRNGWISREIHRLIRRSPRLLAELLLVGAGERVRGCGHHLLVTR